MFTKTNPETAMEIRINEMKRSEYGTIHMELVCNKTAAYVGIDKRGGYQVCTYNASHRAWRGAGKYFASKADALSSYRSAEMKAIIEAASEAATASPVVTH
jgi:hypothetical protein